MSSVVSRIASPFPKVFPPYDEESFFGYLTRVAHANLRISPREIALLAKVPMVNLHDLIRKGLGEVSIAALCGVRPDELSIRRHASIKEKWALLRTEAGELPRQLIQSNTPRIAPHTYREIGYHRYEWEFSFLTFDSQSGEMLIEECPHCLAKFTWERPQFLSCIECGQNLTSKPKQLVDEEVRQAGSVFARLLSTNGDIRAQARQLLAIEVRELPIEALFKFIFELSGVENYRETKNPDWETLLPRALQIASDWPSALLDLIESLKASAGNRAGRFGAKKEFGDFVDLLREWDGMVEIQAIVLPVVRRYLDEHPEITLRADSLLARRVEPNERYATLGEIKFQYGWSHRRAHRLLSIPGVVIGEAGGSGAPLVIDRDKVTKISDALSRLVSKRAIRDIWGLPHEAIRQIAAAGIFKKVTEPYVALIDNTEALYHRDQIASIFDRVLGISREPDCVEPTINFHSIVAEIGKELSDPWVVTLKAVLEGEITPIKVSAKKHQGFRRARFKSSDVNVWVRRKTQQVEKTLSRSEAVKALGVHMDVLAILIAQGKIKTIEPRAGEKGTRIALTEVDNFHREFISSASLAKARYAHPYLLMHTLDARNIDPLPGFPGNRRVYRKSDIPDDLRILSRSEIDQLFAKQNRQIVRTRLPWGSNYGRSIFPEIGPKPDRYKNYR